MSRCFPFPPPGYEKKIPTTQSDTLKKEKHREKKHQKEKDKQEDKEKKDRDKKEKKEKRRDKKKEKERDKDRRPDNLNSSAETRLKVPLQGHSGQNVIQKDSDTCTLSDNHMVPGRNAGYNEGYHGHYASLAEEPNGAKFVHSAERTVRDDAERGGGNSMCEKIIPTPHKRAEGGGKLSHNSKLGNNFDFDYSNLALELDLRLKNEAEQPYDQSQTTNKPVGENQKRDGVVVKSVTSHIIEKINKKVIGSNGRYVGDKSVEVTLIHHTSGMGQGNHDRMARPPFDSDVGNKSEGQQRISHLEDEHLQRGKKRKDKERNGDRKSHEKHKNREKEKIEERSNSRSDQKSAGQGARESCKTDTLIPPSKEMLHPREYNISSTPDDVKMNQAKGFLTNGVIAHVTGPSVFSRPSSLKDENGRAPEPHQTLAKPSIGGPGLSKMDKAGTINGTIRPATEQAVQARPRSPHPDAKRLTDILAIPKIEELSKIDDSDWLISSNYGPGKKQKVDDSRVTTNADMPQVWSKATTIDSADICALPYVVPY